MLEDAALGLTVDATARKRGKARETVKTQRKVVIAKLGCHNIIEAVALMVLNETPHGRVAA